MTPSASHRGGPGAGGVTAGVTRRPSLHAERELGRLYGLRLDLDEALLVLSFFVSDHPFLARLQLDEIVRRRRRLSTAAVASPTSVPLVHSCVAPR